MAAGDVQNHGYSCGAWYTSENNPPDIRVSVVGDCAWTSTSVSGESYAVGGTCPSVYGPAYAQVVAETNIPLAPNGSHNAFEWVYADEPIGTVHWSSATNYVEMTDTYSRFGGGLNTSASMF
jgi:hypothetical protein